MDVGGGSHSNGLCAPREHALIYACAHDCHQNWVVADVGHKIHRRTHARTDGATRVSVITHKRSF